MSVVTAGALAPPHDEDERPRGLVPASQRGRSERLIGDVIVDLGFVRRETVEEVVKLAREQGRPTGQLLLEMGALRHDQLARALAEGFGVDYVDLSMFDIDMGAANLIDVEIAKRYQAVPVGFLPDRSILLAMVDPTNVLTIDEISMITGRKVRSAAAAAEDINALIGRLNRLEESIAEIEEEEGDAEPAQLEGLNNNDAPVIKLVHSLLAKAVEQGASDIHCDPEPGDMKVVFRIDGVLAPAATIVRSMAGSVISRIKIMASIDISERRLSQDGRLAVVIDGRRVDVRVVTLPLVRGEGVVMRILDSGTVMRDLESLGMLDQERNRFAAAVAMQAALTGHLVLSTLHTRDAPAAITRLIDMGVEPFMIADAIDCVVAQRLARTLCSHCKAPLELPEPVLKEHGLADAQLFE